MYAYMYVQMCACMYVHMYACMSVFMNYVSTIAHLWRTEDNFQGLVFHLPPPSSRDQIQVITL